MKTTRYLLPILLLSLLAGCSSPPASAPAPAEKETVWTCSMHPQVRQDKPGKCPLCGMNLVPVSSLGDAVGEKPMAHGPDDGHGQMEMPPAEKPAKRKGTGVGPVVQLTAAQNTAAGIATTEVSRVSLTGQSEVFGEMAADANRQEDYTWYYDGRVQKVLINFNATHVKKGQPILRVYSSDALKVQEEYLAALRERWLRTFYEREVLNTKIGVIGSQLKRIGFSQSDLDKLADKQTFRSEFTITAPRSGSLVKQPPTAGKSFHSADVLFTVADLSSLWFVADVYEKDLGLLELGREIEIACAALPGERLAGRLVYIDPVLDPQKRSVKARFLVDNAAGKLRPELSGTGYLQVDLGRVLAVPQTAVINTGTRNIVYVDLGDGAYEQREVTVGRTGVTPNAERGQWIEIKAGLKDGDRVVTEGSFLIDAEAELQGVADTEKPEGDGQPNPHQH